MSSNGCGQDLDHAVWVRRHLCLAHAGHRRTSGPGRNLADECRLPRLQRETSLPADLASGVSWKLLRDECELYLWAWPGDVFNQEGRASLATYSVRNGLGSQ